MHETAPDLFLAFQRFTLHLFGAVGHVVSPHGNGAAGGCQAAGNGLHCGGFARAVRPQKAQNLACLHLERQVIDGLLLPVEFCQVFYNYVHYRDIEKRAKCR